LIKKEKDTEYVQPQYIVDSLNNLFLLPVSQYAPGIPPPAHLSPFVCDKTEGYVPLRSKEIMHLKGEEVMESDDEPEEQPVPEKKRTRSAIKKEEEAEPVIKKGKGDADSSSEEDNEEDIPTQKANKKAANAKLKKDLEKEQKELAKVLMTNRQRKLYKKIEDEQTTKKE